MKTVKVKSLTELAKILRKDLRGKEQALDSARKSAAKLHAAYVRKNMPVAFGELRGSVHVKLYRVVVDAPYAAAVERGSRPHWMPLEPLIKWVKLRGFQGLASDKSLSRLPGSTTTGHARSVAGELASHRRGGGSGPETPYTAYSWDAQEGKEGGGAVDVAKRIQLAIALKGTKPHWFMRDSIPAAQGFLRQEVSKALSKGSSSGGA